MVNNIILNQYDSSVIKEISPPFIKDNDWYHLSYVNNEIVWHDASVDTRVIIDEQLKDTSIYYKGGRVGIGRGPLHSYKFDISVPENTLLTAFHVGDGKYGFSMGNGTSQGFIPEIIGMGSDENDAGLYLLGRAGNNVPSSTPLIIIDGRNYLNTTVTNRPLFGITNSQYDKYELLINHNGNVGLGKIPEIYKLEVEGVVQATDFILDSSVSFRDLIDIIIEYRDEINKLNDRIHQLENR